MSLPLILAVTTFLCRVVDAPPHDDPRGTAPADASSPNEVAQPHEVPQDDDTTLERATPDPTPPVPKPVQRGVKQTKLDVIEQAGVGGPTAYASAGVLEVGGLGAAHHSNGNTSMYFAPFVGWFVHDGLALSFIHEIRATISDSERRLSSLAMLELSLHLRMTDRLLAFVGAAPGFLYAGGPGFATRGRLGLDVLIGRSGLFRPAAFVTWATRDVFDPLAGTTQTPLGYGVGIAYAAMF